MASKFNRRSFLSRVGATASLGALAAVTGACDQLGLGGLGDSDEEEPEEDLTIDSDLGATEDLEEESEAGGFGSNQQSGLTDSDAGASADPAGNGRGGPAAQANNGNNQGSSGSGPVTDRDTGASADPVNQGRGGSGSVRGITDSDGGASADPAGRGRGGSGRSGSGITDSDTGASADPVGQGRGGGSGCTDSDTGANVDPAGRGQNC
ncbi:MAG: hypothetical protein HKN78_06690 [Sphingomonadaceae bacterium]|nr:hypothetical protein [Sphingomonadaceae bacterium]